MVFNNADATEVIASISKNNDKNSNKSGTETSESEERKRFKLKPFHLLLIMYGIIVVVGALFNYCNRG